MEPLPTPAALEERPAELEIEVVVTEPAATETPGLEEPQSARADAAPPEEAAPEVHSMPPPVERAPAPPPEPPRAPPREWNVWDLERSARQRAGKADRDEEWAALFLHLRPYANADGVLPTHFDDLVQESFSELIEAA